jgi:lysophospholipase L1-like esterase
MALPSEPAPSSPGGQGGQGGQAGAASANDESGAGGTNQSPAETNGGANSGGANSGGAGSQAGGAANGGNGGVESTLTLPLKILILGDSITAQLDSWIFPFQDALRDAGCEQFALIGYDAEPYNGPYPQKDGYQIRRIAVGGFSTRGILHWIQSKQADVGGKPDIVLQYLGANNVYGGFIDGTYNPNVQADPGAAYVEDTLQLLEIVRAENPKVTYVLMRMQEDSLEPIGAAIDQLVEEANTPESEVTFAPAATGVSTTDGLHPDAAGAVTLSGPPAQLLIDWLKERGACSER